MIAAKGLLAGAAVAALVLTVGAAPATSGAPPAVLPAAPATSDVLARLVQDAGSRGASLNASPGVYLQKLDGHLQDVAASRLGGGSLAGAIGTAHAQGLNVSGGGGGVAADVYVKGDVGRAADDLRALGMQVSAVSTRAPERMVEGFIPPAALPQVAALGETQAVQSALLELNTGSVESQGVAATRDFLPPGGPTGAGVSVGIISDSINEVSGGIASSGNNLPPSVVDLQDDPGGTDEGRAMAEIAYDEAPGINSIVFSTADVGGPAGKANAINGLVASGVKVIADDTTYPSEPFFQDDVIAQAVDRAKAAGVAYFAAAGNEANQSWGGTYAPVPDPTHAGSTTEDFDPGAGVTTIQMVGTLPSGHLATPLVLQWAEPWGRATTDLALDVYNMNGSTPVLMTNTGTDTNNLATGIPEEFATIPAGGGSLKYGIAIRRVAGTGTPFMKVIAFTDGGSTTNFQFPTGSGAIDPDAASASGALTVAASDVANPTTPESFSSRGPVTMFFDANGNPLSTPEVRQKPEVTGPDDVSTSLAAFASFQGTSAATPALAGIAALILSAKPAMSIDELYAIMTNPASAVACSPPAGANDCGSGFLLADRALAIALDGTPPVITPTISPATPNGTDGWYTGPVSVAWNVSDPDSPVVDPSGCGPVSVTTDSATTLTCTATSAGGTASVPVTVKSDSTPPSAPTYGGIAAKTYAVTGLPKSSKITCSANDPTSGISGCSVKGYSAVPGRHTLTAVATDNAGLKSTSTLAYTVAKPAAVTKLKLTKGLTLPKLTQSGLLSTVHVAEGATRVFVELVVRVPRTATQPAFTMKLGSLAKRLPKGTVQLRLTLTAKAKQRLANVKRATLLVTVTGSASLSKRVSLHSSLLVKRLG